MSKFLIVDDEMDVREFAKKFFEKRGIQVFAASSGLEAWDVIEHEDLDLVLLDIRMEEMTGVEFLKKLREAGKQTKVIMVSGIEDDLLSHLNHCVEIPQYGNKHSLNVSVAAGITLFGMLDKCWRKKSSQSG